MMSRRTQGTQIGVLLARRTGTAPLFEQERLPELRVDALDHDASVELLEHAHASLGPDATRRVLAAAEGNPLALVELPNLLTDTAAPIGRDGVLPLTDRLQRAFAVQVDDLPSDCKRLLLFAVLEGSGDLALIRRAAGQRGLDTLEPAKRRGLVNIVADVGSLRLRHPLTGSAIVELASSDERRRAHRLIAELSADPDRRAWHSGAATDGPDDGVAEAMEAAGHRWLQRGDTAGAIRAWVRSGRLSSRPHERARRLSLAAHHAAQRTTQFRESQDLLAEALAADPSISGSLSDASAAAFLLINADANIDAANALLAAALPDLSSRAPPMDQLENYLTAHVVVSWLAERPEWWQRIRDMVAQTDLPPQSRFRLVLDVGADPAHRGCGAIGLLDANLSRIGSDRSPDDILGAAVCSYWVDRLALCHSALSSFWERHDAELFSLHTLVYLCVAEQQMGDWNAASGHAATGVRRCTDTAANALTWQFQLVEGLIAAGQGDIVRAVALADDIERWVRPRGIRFGVSAAHQIRMLIAWAVGDPEDAFWHASAISPAGTLRSHAPRALFVAHDVVEAAMRTGRRGDAVAHVDALRAAQIECLSPRLAMIQLACEAWVSDGDEALQRFEAALAVEGADRSPFDFARVHLALGEALRRRRTGTVLAREHLRTAATIFRALGAAPWARRADAEIRASGATRADSDRSHTTLTAQELQIARLAATGMRNKEIGADLYLSPRTVSAHLYHIFPKLGITTRAALRDALDSIEEPTDS